MQRKDSPPSDYYRQGSGGQLGDMINSIQPAAARWLMAPSLWCLTAADTEWTEKRPSAQMDISAVKRPLLWSLFLTAFFFFKYHITQSQVKPGLSSRSHKSFAHDWWANCSQKGRGNSLQSYIVCLQNVRLNLLSQLRWREFIDLTHHFAEGFSAVFFTLTIFKWQKSL